MSEWNEQYEKESARIMSISIQEHNKLAESLGATPTKTISFQSIAVPFAMFLLKAGVVIDGASIVKNAAVNGVQSLTESLTESLTDAIKYRYMNTISYVSHRIQKMTKKTQTYDKFYIDAIQPNEPPGFHIDIIVAKKYDRYDRKQSLAGQNGIRAHLLHARTYLMWTSIQHLIQSIPYRTNRDGTFVYVTL